LLIYRSPSYDSTITDSPVVPSLASSVPSIIANSSPVDPPVITRSRSDADGEEPTLSPVASPVFLPLDDTNRTAVRQPADGLGNPSTTNTTTWRTSDSNEERRVMSWSSDDDDDDNDEVPPSSRLRPVLIGGEDNTQYHHSDDEDTLLTNLSLNPHT
jgi:hypothetical protein